MRIVSRGPEFSRHVIPQNLYYKVCELAMACCRQVESDCGKM
jgi:hypothetical protein